VNNYEPKPPARLLPLPGLMVNSAFRSLCMARVTILFGVSLEPANSLVIGPSGKKTGERPLPYATALCQSTS